MKYQNGLTFSKLHSINCIKLKVLCKCILVGWMDSMPPFLFLWSFITMTFKWVRSNLSFYMQSHHRPYKNSLLVLGHILLAFAFQPCARQTKYCWYSLPWPKVIWGQYYYKKKAGFTKVFWFQNKLSLKYEEKKLFWIKLTPLFFWRIRFLWENVLIRFWYFLPKTLLGKARSKWYSIQKSSKIVDITPLLTSCYPTSRRKLN